MEDEQKKLEEKQKKLAELTEKLESETAAATEFPHVAGTSRISRETKPGVVDSPPSVAHPPPPQSSPRAEQRAAEPEPEPEKWLPEEPEERLTEAPEKWLPEEPEERLTEPAEVAPKRLPEPEKWLPEPENWAPPPEKWVRPGAAHPVFRVDAQQATRQAAQGSRRSGVGSGHAVMLGRRFWICDRRLWARGAVTQLFGTS